MDECERRIDRPPWKRRDESILTRGAHINELFRNKMWRFPFKISLVIMQHSNNSDMKSNQYRVVRALRNKHSIGAGLVVLTLHRQPPKWSACSLLN